jgi:hypothetical protein
MVGDQDRSDALKQAGAESGAAMAAGAAMARAKAAAAIESWRNMVCLSCSSMHYALKQVLYTPNNGKTQGKYSTPMYASRNYIR